MTQEYFRFALSADISLAIPLENMGKVVQLETQHICTIPGVASFWYGIVNLKGSLLWVLDSDRYFNLNYNQSHSQQKKITAVVVKQNLQATERQVALVTPRLEGIIALKSDQLEPLTDQIANIWHTCSSAMVDQGNKNIYILDSINLLKQLHQKSSLVSA